MTTPKLFALTCGWLTGPMGGFLAGEEGRLKVPVPCYLIDHPRGKVLFDSGLHPRTQTDPAGRLGGKARVFDVHFQPGEEVAARLGAVDLDAAKVDYLINSHLHFDHTGGNELLPNATVVVQRREWEAGLDADLAAANHYDAHDYRTGQDVELVDGEHDLFGDGTIVCLPTFGHTPGHQSLRVQLDGGPVILTGDACYLRRTLEELHLPSVVFDEDGMRRSLQALRQLRDLGARIFYGHDPDFWAGVPQAPVAIV
jgi:N-acyl homoserine lactone hydrolase